MKTDIEIAQSVELKPITEVVEKVGIDFDDLELYGKYKAKLSFDKINAVKDNKPGKLILVTAINPTPAGEGKSTMSIGLADALNKIGKKTMIAFVNHLLVRLWESKVVLQVVATLKCSRWKISTSTSQGICTLLLQQIMLCQPFLTIIFTKEMLSALTNVVSFGNVWLTLMTVRFVM